MEKALLIITTLIIFSTVAYAPDTTLNQTNSCEGVTCLSPPANFCVGNTAKVYGPQGTCSNGQCSYVYTPTDCPNGCENGVCTATTVTSNVTCTDSDGGKNYNQAGTATAGGQSLTDHCNSDGTLTEKYCEGSEIRAETYQCACSNAACLSTPGTCANGDVQKASCPDGSQYMKANCVNGNWIEVKYFDEPCKASKTFRYAKWSCYDGYANSMGDGTFCKAESTWRAVADSDCKSHCSGEKCGVNYYEVREECSSGATCPAVCVPVWKKTDGGCTFIECGSGCGADGVTTFKTQEECNNNNQKCPEGCTCTQAGSSIMVKNCNKPCNYNGVCESGEEGCKDCVVQECPLTTKCADGTTSACYKKEAGCVCNSCPLSEKNIPMGCAQETDSSGLIRVVCDNKNVVCPSYDSSMKTKCADSGGQPVMRKEPNGCDVFFCDFGNGDANNRLFAAQATCPTSDEVMSTFKKCNEMGLKAVIAFEGGCKIGKCIQEQRAQECGLVPGPIREQTEKECAGKGLDVIASFDDNGCQKMTCGSKADCPKDLPAEAYDKCNKQGGQLIVKRDNGGCIANSQCLMRGDSTQTYVGEITEMPTSSELLSIAFKLEELKLDLDKLARKTNDIADYYKSVGSNEENRFRRVADMFNGAKDKVDEIKTKIRDRLDNLTTDDIMEIKQDIKYLKDVTIKDILYVMLSTGDDMEKIKNNEQTDCSTDGGCFDRALRICQNMKYKPDGNTVVEIQGLEDNKCIVFAYVGNLSMRCKIEKYSMGIKDPATDLFPYCEGTLLETVKVINARKTGTLEIPGECSGEACKDYCVKGPEEAKKCLEYLSNTMSPDAIDKIKIIAAEMIQRQPLQAATIAGSPSATSDSGSSPTTAGGGGGGSSSGSCSGCLNNGVCDPGECSQCQDCLR